MIGFSDLESEAEKGEWKKLFPTTGNGAKSFLEKTTVLLFHGVWAKRRSGIRQRRRIMALLQESVGFESARKRN